MQYQKEEVRNRIIDAAFSEFEKNGFYRASMLQISTRARVPIGNLYRYFNGKEALFKACVDSAYSYCLTLMDSVFDAGLNEAGCDGTTISLLKGAKSQGRGIKLLTEKSGGSEYSDFINQITEFGYRKLEETFAAKGYPVDEFVAKTIAANITEGVLSVLTRAPEERRQDLMTKLMNFYFRDLGERVGGNGQ